LKQVQCQGNLINEECGGGEGAGWGYAPRHILLSELTGGTCVYVITTVMVDTAQLSGVEQ